MNPKNLLGMIEPEKIKKNHIRTLLTLMGAPEGEGFTTSTLEKLLSISRRTLGRVKPVLVDLDLATVATSTGSKDEDVWSLTPATRKQLTASGSMDLSALSTSATKKAKGPNPLEFGSTKYRSVLERDVAVCLTCLGVAFKPEVSYRKILKLSSPDGWDETSIPDWRCDFIVRVSDVDVKVHGVIEVAGVKGNPAYRATLKQKELALVPVGVPFLQLDGVEHLDRIPEFIGTLRERAADLARAARVSSPASRIPGGAYVTPSGRHVDPRGIKKKLESGETRRPPPSLYPEAPADEARPTLPVETPEERELRRAEDALYERRYEEQKVAVAALRAKFKAKWAEEDAKATAEARVAMLAAALEWDEKQRESRKRRTNEPTHANEEGERRDLEAPWEHSDLAEEAGIEATGGDLSEHL